MCKKGGSGDGWDNGDKIIGKLKNIILFKLNLLISPYLIFPHISCSYTLNDRNDLGVWWNINFRSHDIIITG